MLLGIQLRPDTPAPGGNEFDAIKAVTLACEAAGLDAVFMADHFMFGDPLDLQNDNPQYECFTTLGALAASTTRIKVGQLTVGVPYRNPALLAKMCTTLDLISHGRTIIGMGAAWHEPEFDAYGWPFPSLRERMERLEEAVQIVHLMLTERPANFSGKHYTVQNARNDPMPVQKPRPPILVGGSGERVTLRIVAQYADFCNVGGDPERVAHSFSVLRQHCENVGRPFEQITLSNDLGLIVARDDADLAAKRQRYPDHDGIIGTPEMVVDRLHQYAEVGSQYVTFHMPDAHEIEPIELLGEHVIPRIAAF